MKKNRVRVMSAWVTAILLTSGVAGIGFPNAANASPRIAPPGRLVVNEFRPDQVITMSPDGTDRERVMRYPSRGIGLSLYGISATSDGGTIATAFGVIRRSTSTDYIHLFTVKPDGSELTQLTHGKVVDSSPTFSPGGDKIAFLREHGHATSLMVMNSDGSQVENLTDPGEPQPQWLGWSPDGQYIAISTGSKLVLTNPEGTWYRFLRSVSAQKQIYLAGWSPDSSTLAYDLTGDLFSMSVDGTHRQRITNTPRLSEYSATYSPDGTAIACIQDTPHGQRDVVVMDADGSHRHVIRTKVNDEIQVVWSS